MPMYFSGQSSRPTIERPGLDPSAVESVFFSTERFSNSLNIRIHLHYLRYKSLKLSTRIPVRTNVRRTLKVQNAPAENMDSIVAKFARIAFRIARISKKSQLLKAMMRTTLLTTT